jgi:hypothetical protein
MACNNIFNIDKTGIWYDPVPHTIIVYAGRSPTTMIAKKHSGRIIAMLRVCVFGKNFQFCLF